MYNRYVRSHTFDDLFVPVHEAPPPHKNVPLPPPPPTPSRSLRNLLNLNIPQLDGNLIILAVVAYFLLFDCDGVDLFEVAVILVVLYLLDI